MSTAVALQRPERPHLPALALSEPELMGVLRSSFYPGASDQSIKLVTSYCKAAGLDVMQKPVHIVPMKVKTGEKDGNGYDKYAMRDVVMPGIGSYRIQAARTGQLAGISEPEFGPMLELTYAKSTWVDGEDGRRKKVSQQRTVKYPEWCKVTVHRQMSNGHIAEFTAVEYWIENYATAGNDTDAPNAMWEKRARGQLAKCAEAQALRKGFPEATGSQPTAEEMEGKQTFDDDTIDVTPHPPIKMPQAKPAPKEQAAVPPPAQSDPEAPAAAPASSAPIPSGKLKYLQNKAASLGADLATVASTLALNLLELDDDGFVKLKSALLDLEAGEK